MIKMNKTILAIGLAGLVSGCSTTKDVRQHYTLRETHIILDRQKNINEIYTNLNKDKSTCNGFTCGSSVYVKCNKFGEPDFYTLGHEIWHRVKGDFHDRSNYTK